MNAALPGGYPPVSPVTQHRKCERSCTNCKSETHVPNRIDFENAPIVSLVVPLGERGDDENAHLQTFTG